MGPVTPRYVEALVRLSEARARAELRRIVLPADVEDVIEIITHGTDFEECLPSAPLRKGKSRPNAIADVLCQAIERIARSGRSDFKEHELRSLIGKDVASADFDRALYKLHEIENVLILTGP